MEPTRFARPRRSAFLAAFGLLALLATACGSGNDAAAVADADGTTEPAETEITTTSTEPSSTAPPSSVTTTEPPSEDPEALAAAEAIGDRFMQARNDHDGATLVSLLAPDASFGGFELAQTLDEYPLQTEWERVMGWQFLDASCSASSPDRVSCSYSVLEAFNERAGKPPFPGSVILLELDSDQMIQRVSNNFNPDEDFYKEAEFNFLLWLRENHPGDSERMYDDRPFLINPPILTPEAIQLFEERAAEYLAPEPPLVAGQAAVLGDSLTSMNEAVGLPAPTIEGFDYLSTEPVSWGGDGPAAVLFAPLGDWCPHCSIHLEQLTDYLADNDGPDGAQVLLVTQEEEPSGQYPQDEWLASRGWSFATVLDPSGIPISKAFGITSVPVWVLVGSDGTVAHVIDGHHASPAEVFSRIDDLE